MCVGAENTTPRQLRAAAGKACLPKRGLDPPAQRLGRPPSATRRGPCARQGSLGVMRSVSSRAPGLRAPRAPTASGGDIWESAPEGDGATQPGSGFCEVPACASLLEAGRSGPTQLLPAPWEGSVVRSLERKAAAAHSTYRLAFCFSSLRTRERHNSIISSTCNTAFSSFALEPRVFRRGISQFPNKYLWV